MLTAPFIIRSRRRRDLTGQGARRLSQVALAIATAALLVLGALGMVGAVVYAYLDGLIPPVREIEEAIGEAGSDTFPVTRLVDRSEQHWILELIHPLGVGRRWIKVDPASEAVQTLIAATLSAQDPSFWGNPGYESRKVVDFLVRSLLGQEGDLPAGTIAEQLVESVLLPVSVSSIPDWLHLLARVLSASRLTHEYSKEQILEWYLNTAYLGNLAYGFDAAALVYFGKPASELSLTETVMLASLAPVGEPQDTARRREILQQMVSQGWIDEGLASLAAAEFIAPRSSEELHRAVQWSGFEGYALSQLEAVLGPQLLRRPGLVVVTTLDWNLQQQVECIALAHVELMSGISVTSTDAHAEQEACLGSRLLPPLRPGDVGQDHRLSSYGAVVLDPSTGEVLSMADNLPAGAAKPMAETPRAGGTILAPFLYLTAFSKGYAPASMVLDIPTSITIADGQQALEVMAYNGQFHGPVSMRVAQASLLTPAAARVLKLVGVENVLNTAHLMGIGSLDEPDVDYAPLLTLGSGEVKLLDLAFAYGVLANGGTMAGGEVTVAERRPGFRSLQPIAILRVEEASGSPLYTALHAERVVVSPELAYLMVDALSDEAARQLGLGASTVLEIDRPSAAAVGITSDQRDNWTVGFTPSRVVAVWAGNLEDEATVGVDAVNGAAPIWNAVLRQATMQSGNEGWQEPPGLTRMDVCYPSGLLATEYCPMVVPEIFIDGTEPSSYDDLYRPFFVNKETGNLATLFTDVEQVQEVVYMIPPAEAMEWAAAAGIAQPPQEYDPIHDFPPGDPGAGIHYPAAFEYLKGVVAIRGNAHKEDMSYYRLEVGSGLYPTQWIQLGEDVSQSVVGGLLGEWDTRGQDGLFTLQLIVVMEDGTVVTSAVPVTVDNRPPVVTLIRPQGGETFSRTLATEVELEADPRDETGLESVEFYVDGRRIATLTDAPYVALWTLGEVGDHRVQVRAYDMAGNMAMSEVLTIHVLAQ